MARNPKQLSQQQIEVLSWIRAGAAPEQYTEGFTHRIVARALEGRGLVAISGRGPTWAANITAAGVAWLDAPPVQPPVELSEADELLKQVIEAGGSINVDSPYRDDRYLKLIRQSMKSEQRPFGKRLELVSVGSWHQPEKRVVLVDHLDDQIEGRPVPVARQVRDYHPAVKAFLADKEWSFVTADHTKRAGHILQAIAAEAQRRELSVLRPSEVKVRDGSRVPGHVHLAMRDEDAVYWVRILEIAGPRGAKSGAATLESGEAAPRLARHPRL